MFVEEDGTRLRSSDGATITVTGKAATVAEAAITVAGATATVPRALITSEAIAEVGGST